MDKKHLAILDSVSENEGEIFGPILEKTNEKIPISRRPFGRRLKDLQMWGYVTKKGIHYFLDTPRIRKTDYSKQDKQFNQLRKKVKRLLDSKKSPATWSSMVKEIFDEWYVPISYERLCYLSLLTKGEQYKINKVLERCEKLILKITTKLEERYSGTIPILTHSDELVFLQKIKK